MSLAQLSLTVQNRGLKYYSFIVTITYEYFSARTSDITQICAVGGEQKFEKYVLPSQPITKGAMEVTGLEVLGGILHCKGQPVPSVTTSEALLAFMDFLSQFPQPPVLLGHNIKTFDVHVLHHHLQSHNMCSEFKQYISGFVDTRIVARQALPGEPSYKQEELVK